MNRSTYIFVCALGVFMTPACGDDDDDDNSGQSIQALCQDACATAAGLSCPNDDAATCVSDCQLGGDLPEACQATAQTALGCLSERPASDWECDADGEAALKDGICTAEGAALLACLFDNTDDGTCPFEEDNECDDPTGTDLCPAGTDLADCG